MQRKAFDAYQRAMGDADEEPLEGDVDARAERELKRRLDEMEQQNSDNPAMQQLLQQMRRDLDR